MAVSEYWREHYGPHCIRGVPLIIQQKEPPVGGVSAVYQVSDRVGSVDSVDELEPTELINVGLMSRVQRRTNRIMHLGRFNRSVCWSSK